jgi:hypothetical protein
MDYLSGNLERAAGTQLAFHYISNGHILPILYRYLHFKLVNSLSFPYIAEHS